MSEAPKGRKRGMARADQLSYLAPHTTQTLEEYRRTESHSDLSEAEGAYVAWLARPS